MSEGVLNKRSHGIIIFENALKTASSFIIPLMVTWLPGFKSGKLGGMLVSIILLAVFFGLDIVYAIAAWFFRTYSIQNGVFSMHYGVFVKKNREIPIHKIVTIHEMQTLTQRLFGAWTIKLDTGSSVQKETEVQIVLSKEDLPLIRRLLKPNDSSDPSIQNEAAPKSQILYRSPNSSLVKMGLTSNAIFAGLAIIFSLLQFFMDFFQDAFSNIIGQAESLIKNTALQITFQFVLLLFLSFILYSILSLTIAAITSLVKYHHFVVSKNENTLLIQYGLLKRNSFSIPESKIQAVYIKQSFLRQLMGFASVHIESVGYGNEKGEEALLIPLVKLGEAHGLILKILSFYHIPEAYQKVPQRSLRRFIIRALILPVIIIVPLAIFVPFGLISLILAPIAIVSGILQYRNSGVNWNNHALFMSYGGYTRVYAEVRRKGIQSVIKKATPFQRMARLFTLHLSIQGTVFGKLISVKHLDESLFKEIRNLI